MMMLESDSSHGAATDFGDAPPIRSSSRNRSAGGSRVKTGVDSETKMMLRNAFNAFLHDGYSNDCKIEFENIRTEPDHPIGKEDEMRTHSDSEDYRLHEGLVLSNHSTRDHSPERYRKSKSLSTKVKECMVEWLCFCVTVMAILIALYATGVIKHLPESGDNSTGSASNSTTINDGFKPLLPHRLIQAAEFLSKAEISDRRNLEDIAMPQFQAAYWISELDELAYTIPTSRIDRNYIPFVQRYILALLYFATGGHNWNVKCSFLGNQDVCQWFKIMTLNEDENLTLGVSCNNLGNVNRLLMRKFQAM
jgi:hypothetical protein